jgi:fructose-1,6-bisphosphatase II / sedoheptulose-1,7-bisphosphatase
MIEEVRATGAAIRLIGDGDVAGVIHATDPEETGIDIYMGIGGAPEGVLAAAALRCIGGQMQGRLQLNTDEKIARAAPHGHRRSAQEIPNGGHGARRRAVCRHRRYGREHAVRRALRPRSASRPTPIVMRSSTRTVREIKARHQDLDKF